ncbi:S26 family signal peptidase [Nitrospirillum amazonense]|uniref:S26 family signal peptidase n=1 Tax=Nitrospirillum amazonense TaxID=28077 RepID=UPI002412A0A0|nr:S26 family signal peptidase [Nitrospirillum amazonense]MDG3444540.1 S26 family signal peptidase [Nitrospirillum amazonense]
MTPRQALLAGWFVAAFAGLVWVKGHYVFETNLSGSLPGIFYWVKLGEPVPRGGLALFPAPPGNPEFREDFVKIVQGLGGDLVERRDGVVFVQGVEIGRLLEKTSKGHVLIPGPTGVIPEGFAFVRGTHARSYDSRYGEIGFIPVSQFRGRAYQLL